MEDGNIKSIKKIERSPHGLVTALFDSMDALNANTISVEEARALANTGRVIVNVARLELEAVRMSNAMGKTFTTQTLPGLGNSARQLTDAEPKK